VTGRMNALYSWERDSLKGLHDAEAMEQSALGLGPHLFVKVPRPRDSKVTFRSSSQVATYYFQFNHSNLEAIPLSALPKDTTSELAAYLHANTFKC